MSLSNQMENWLEFRALQHCRRTNCDLTESFRAAGILSQMAKNRTKTLSLVTAGSFSSLSSIRRCSHFRSEGRKDADEACRKFD